MVVQMTTAIFPVRANPPHLGHVISLLKIKDDYDKIIIAISDNTYDGIKPQIIPVEEVRIILNEIFKHYPNKYEIVMSKERFISRKTFDDLPSFDVVVTGNVLSYENMKKQGKKVRFLERTPIYRGSFMREAYIKGMEYEKRHFNNHGCS